MASSTTKTFHSLVLDAGPLISNETSLDSLRLQSEKLYTVPAVIEEIRDANARARLDTLLGLGTLEQRLPKPASIKVISDFAQRTGDLEVLSNPDIQILALAYELECERNHGDWRLRKVPGQKQINGTPPASLKVQNKDLRIPEPEGESLESGRQLAQETPDILNTNIASTTEAEHNLEQIDQEDPDPDDKREPSQVDSITRNDEDPSKISTRHTNLPDNAQMEEISAVINQTDELTLRESADDDSDSWDDDGWTTPSKVRNRKSKPTTIASNSRSEPKTMQVATMTTDFAMQNVLLRMNLNLVSSSLRSIQQLKIWVLRCHACFTITRDMNKQFCSRCGKPTLLRTSCSTEKDGTFKVHLKKNMQWNSRGNVYNVPKPVAGTSSGKVVSGGGKGGWGQELILAEDQKEYVSALTIAARRKEKDPMDEHFLPSILSGDRKGSTGKPKVGAGRNINSRKRRN